MSTQMLEFNQIVVRFSPNVFISEGKLSISLTVLNENNVPDNNDILLTVRPNMSLDGKIGLTVISPLIKPEPKSGSGSGSDSDSDSEFERTNPPVKKLKSIILKKKSSSSWVMCSNCGKNNRSRSTTCKYCHYILSTNAAPAAAPVAAAPVAAAPVSNPTNKCKHGNNTETDRFGLCKQCGRFPGPHGSFSGFF